MDDKIGEVTDIFGRKNVAFNFNRHITSSAVAERPRDASCLSIS